MGSGGAVIKNPEIAKSIKPGMTKTEVRSILGNPQSIQSENTWSYYYSQMNDMWMHFFIPKMPDMEDYSLDVFFENNKVLSVNYSGSGRNAVKASMKYSDMKKSQPTRNNSNQTHNTKPVYSTLQSSVYHSAECIEIQNEDVLRFNTPNEAINAGGIACSGCNPN